MLKPQAELFYRRLMSVVDDFGRFSAHPSLLRAACYPLRIDVVREADITRWLAEVQSAGLIALYAVDGKRYLEMTDFRQQVRAKESKFPAKPKCAADAQHLHSRRKAPAHLDEGVVEDEGAGATPPNPPAGGKVAGLIAGLPPPIPADLDTAAFREAWEGFLRHRVEKRQKLTASAADKALRKLEKMGHDRAIEAIEHSVSNGWQGIFEPGRGNGAPGGPAAQQANARRADRAAREHPTTARIRSL